MLKVSKKLICPVHGLWREGGLIGVEDVTIISRPLNICMWGAFSEMMRAFGLAPDTAVIKVEWHPGMSTFILGLARPHDANQPEKTHFLPVVAPEEDCECPPKKS